MDIKLGTFELRPGFVRLGGLLMLSWRWWTSKRFRFKFYRPDAENTSHYLFWGPLEVVWDGPKSLRQCGGMA